MYGSRLVHFDDILWAAPSMIDEQYVGAFGITRYGYDIRRNVTAPFVTMCVAFISMKVAT
eukprot:7629148-Pyramimonas_sp.AAC.1